MKDLTDKFDNEIAGIIHLKESISIESLLEGPLLIASQIWENEAVDQDARRYFFRFLYKSERLL